MERKQACIDESTDFLCPTCGASAFEVIGTQRNCADDGTEEESLVMRCHDCLDLFYHRLGVPEPCWPLAESHEEGKEVACPLTHEESGPVASDEADALAWRSAELITPIPSAVKNPPRPEAD